MAAEGVAFRPASRSAWDVSVDELLAEFDAVVLSGGAEWPRDLDVCRRELPASISPWIS
jgi:glutamate synthase (NADPH/NADH) small chain